MKYFTGLKDIILLPNFCGYVNASYSYPLHVSNVLNGSSEGREKWRRVLIAPSRGVSGALLTSLTAAVTQFNQHSEQVSDC
jgi:hypothetical protein